MKTWGPKRPISQDPGHLDLMWSGDIHRIVATPWLLIDIYLLSKMPQSPGTYLDVPVDAKLSRPSLRCSRKLANDPTLFASRTEDTTV